MDEKLPESDDTSHSEDHLQANNPPHAKQSTQQHEFVNLCAEWIARDLRPLEIVEDEGFKNIVSSLFPRYHNVTADIVKRTLQNKEKTLDEQFRALFSSVPFMSVTTDVWTDESTKSYASLTVHFIDRQCKYRSHLLACSQIKGKHTGSALSQFIAKVCQNYDILVKVVFICVDNASNAKSSVRITAAEHALLLDLEQDSNICSVTLHTGKTSPQTPDSSTDSPAHVLEVKSTGTDGSVTEHEIVLPSSSSAIDCSDEDAIFAFIDDDEVELPPLDDGSKFFKEISTTLEPFSTTKLLHDASDRAPMTKRSVQLTLNRQPCIAHTLQLSVRKALDLPAAKSAIASVRKTCKYFRKSSTGASFLSDVQAKKGCNPLRLLLDVKTRWGSTRKMIQRFLKIREYVDEAVLNLYQA